MAFARQHYSVTGFIVVGLFLLTLIKLELDEGWGWVQSKLPRITTKTPPKQCENREPRGFTKTHAACLMDQYCHTVFLHTPKTGGTSIEFVLEKMHNNEVHISSCCGGRLMDDFRKRKMEYCMSSFRSFQISPALLPEVVTTCEDIYQGLQIKSNSTKSHYLQVMVSIREPIARTMSVINHICNKNLKRRSNEIQGVCRGCSFQKDKDFYLNVSKLVNEEYSALQRAIVTRRDNASSVDKTTALWQWLGGELWAPSSIDPSISNKPIPRSIPILVIDNIDLDSFFSGLHQYLVDESEYENQHLPLPKGTVLNTGVKGICDFYMPSVLMKSLSPAVFSIHSITSSGDSSTPFNGVCPALQICPMPISWDLVKRNKSQIMVNRRFGAEDPTELEHRLN